MFLNTFLIRYKKTLTIIIFIVIFLLSIVRNIPTSVLGNTINHYSQEKLKLYNTTGTFWHGSGLLVAMDPKTQQSAPLILLNWKISLGFKKLVDIGFFIDNNQFADTYLNTKGVNLSNLNLSLSIGQVSELFGVVKNLGLSGNINVSTDHILLGKGNQGTFKIKLSTISSSLSPVNPIGDYDIFFDTNKGLLDISSNNSSTLMLNGSGSLSNLTLKARVAESKKEKMLQFITMMGLPQPDGSYNLKIF